MGRGEPRQAVVDRVRRRQPGALEAQPAQQRVRLHDVGQRRGDDLLLAGDPGGDAILPDRVVAQPGQRVAGERPQAAALVGRVRRPAGVGLEPSGQGVAHPGDQVPHRGLGDDLRIDQHQVRVPRQEQVA